MDTRNSPQLGIFWWSVESRYLGDSHVAGLNSQSSSLTLDIMELFGIACCVVLQVTSVPVRELWRVSIHVVLDCSFLTEQQCRGSVFVTLGVARLAALCRVGTQGVQAFDHSGTT